MGTLTGERSPQTSETAAAIGGKSCGMSEKRTTHLLRNEYVVNPLAKRWRYYTQCHEIKYVCRFSYIVHSCADFIVLEYFLDKYYLRYG